MPNIWTGKGNPYTRQEVCDRLQATLDRGEAIIAAGAGTGISAKFIEKGGADLIIIYNSGRFRMAGHGSTCGLMAYDDANHVATADEAKAMADVGADAIIAHVGTTVGGSIGVTGAVCTMDDAVKRTQAIIEGGRSSGRRDIFYLSHGGPIATPEDATYVNQHTDCVGFVGASSLERLGVEGTLVELTQG